MQIMLALVFIAISYIPTAIAHDFDKAIVTSQELGNGIHMLIGKGGNLGVLETNAGFILIDDQYAPMTKKIERALKKIVRKPVRFLINTHWHSDHTGGNENFGKKDAVIVAHSNVRKRLSTDQFIAAFNSKNPAAPEVAWPVITFTRDLTFHLGGQTTQLIHRKNAHTDGDTVVYFKEANVLHTGDTFFNGLYPFIDFSTGGSLAGMIRATKQNLKLVNQKTKIIPGHGPLANKKDLQNYLAMLQSVYNKLATYKEKGYSLEKIQQLKPTKAFDEKWGGGFLSPDNFVAVAYKSL